MDVETAVVARKGGVQGDDQLLDLPVLPHLQTAGGDRDASGDGRTALAVHLADGDLAQVHVAGQREEVEAGRIREGGLQQLSLF